MYTDESEQIIMLSKIITKLHDNQGSPILQYFKVEAYDVVDDFCIHVDYDKIKDEIKTENLDKAFLSRFSFLLGLIKGMETPGNYQITVNLNNKYFYQINDIPLALHLFGLYSKEEYNQYAKIKLH